MFPPNITRGLQRRLIPVPKLNFHISLWRIWSFRNDKNVANFFEKLSPTPDDFISTIFLCGFLTFTRHLDIVPISIWLKLWRWNAKSLVRLLRWSLLGINIFISNILNFRGIRTSLGALWIHHLPHTCAWQITEAHGARALHAHAPINILIHFNRLPRRTHYFSVCGRNIYKLSMNEMTDLLPPYGGVYWWRTQWRDDFFSSTLNKGGPHATLTLS